MAVRGQWKICRDTSSPDVKAPKNRSSIVLSSAECSFFGEHTFTDADHNGTAFLLTIPATIAVLRGYTFFIANPKSAAERDKWKVYGSIYPEPPHTKTANFAAGEFAHWVELQDEQQVGTAGKYYFSISDRVSAPSQQDAPFGSYMIVGATAAGNGISVAWFCK